MKIRHWLYYVLGGMLICLVMWRGLPFQGTGDFQFFLFAGALGGAVYWRIAGRKAGDWAGAPIEEPAVVQEHTEATHSESDILELPTRLPDEDRASVEGPQSPAQRPESWVRSR